jgi:twinkle protein
MIEDKIKAMPPGLIDGSEMEYKNSDTNEETIETGFYEYDYHVEDWKLQEITIIFGRNGEGKTTFVSQIITHCLQKRVPTFLFSGEMSDKKIQDWLYRQLIGDNLKYLRTVQTKYKKKIEPREDIVKMIKEWHRNCLYMYDRNARETVGNLDVFFEVMELAAKRFGCKLFIIDNLMSILEEHADSLYSDQANFVQRCKDFATRNWAHVVLLAHPNKGKDELDNAQTGNLDKTDISGSNNIPNKADNIIAVERNWGENAQWDAIVTSLKDRETGQRKVFRYNLSKTTLRFYNNQTKEKGTFGWEKFVDEYRDKPREPQTICPWDMED